MTVNINTDRKAVVLEYDEINGDTYTIRATGEAGDVHASGPHPNNGNAIVTYPADFVGNSHIEITGSDGSRTEGDIEIS